MGNLATLHPCSEDVKDHFSSYAPRGNHPPDLLTARTRQAIFFGQPLTKAFEKCISVPNFHSASDRCWLPLLYFFRSTRVRLSIIGYL